MRGNALDKVSLPDEWWTSSDVLDTLAARDVASVFRSVQRLTGLSQTHIGSATGLSQAQVSEIMSNKRQVSTIDVLARIVEGLAIPHPARLVLLLGDLRYADTPDEPARSAPRQPSPAIHTAPAAAPDERFSDVTAIYATRSEFTSNMPTHTLFDHAHDIRAAGLSLNLLCQHYADDRLTRLLTGGTQVRCLFLDPDGDAIKAREKEEGFAAGHLSSLTALNMHTLTSRVRDRLPDDKRDHLQIASYDETIRFNITLIDDTLCIAQPYLPELRGVESPTMVIQQRSPHAGLYPTFARIFTMLWERSQPR
jgi:transcriptional regulator with XRE-family HTH domain